MWRAPAGWRLALEPADKARPHPAPDRGFMSGACGARHQAGHPPRQAVWRVVMSSVAQVIWDSNRAVPRLSSA